MGKLIGVKGHGVVKMAHGGAFFGKQTPPAKSEIDLFIFIVGPVVAVEGTTHLYNSVTIWNLVPYHTAHFENLLQR